MPQPGANCLSKASGSANAAVALGSAAAGNSVRVLSFDRDVLYPITSRPVPSAHRARYGNRGHASAQRRTNRTFAHRHRPHPRPGDVAIGRAGKPRGAQPTMRTESPSICFSRPSTQTSSVAKTRQIVIRQDVGDLPAFALIGASSLAAYLWETILVAGRDVGLQAVGQAALKRLNNAIRRPQGHNSLRVQTSSFVSVDPTLLSG